VNELKCRRVFENNLLFIISDWLSGFCAGFNFAIAHKYTRYSLLAAVANMKLRNLEALRLYF
jgi:hypothetical protein